MQIEIVSPVPNFPWSWGFQSQFLVLIKTDFLLLFYFFFFFNPVYGVVVTAIFSVENRGRLCRTGPLLLPLGGFWGLNSGCLACPLTPLNRLDNQCKVVFVLRQGHISSRLASNLLCSWGCLCTSDPLALHPRAGESQARATTPSESRLGPVHFS